MLLTSPMLRSSLDTLETYCGGETSIRLLSMGYLRRWLQYLADLLPDETGLETELFSKLGYVFFA